MSELAFEHRVIFAPSYDKRSDEPGKNYGICGMRLTFAAIGPKGAVQWMIGTGWYVESARKHLSGFDSSVFDVKNRPAAWDLGFHAHEPQYDGHTKMGGHCDIIGGDCYYDGSSLNAELLLERFLAEGEAYLWPALEAYYRHTFEDGPWPFEVEAVQAKAAGRYV